jgi:hypothetical protein
MSIDEDVTTLKYALKLEVYDKCNQYIKSISQKLPLDAANSHTLQNLQDINKFDCKIIQHRSIISMMIDRYDSRKQSLKSTDSIGITIPGTNGYYTTEWRHKINDL